MKILLWQKFKQDSNSDPLKKNFSSLMKIESNVWVRTEKPILYLGAFLFIHKWTCQIVLNMFYNAFYKIRHFSENMF